MTGEEIQEHAEKCLKLIPEVGVEMAGVIFRVTTRYKMDQELGRELMSLLKEDQEVLDNCKENYKWLLQ